jgi:hypothetical protein
MKAMSLSRMNNRTQGEHRFSGTIRAQGKGAPENCYSSCRDAALMNAGARRRTECAQAVMAYPTQRGEGGCNRLNRFQVL